MSAEATFTTTILAMGNNTGIEIPSEVVAALGAGSRPTLDVTVGSYSWAVTVGVMGGKHLISLSKAHREASGLAAGDEIAVHVLVASGPREVDVPAALAAALKEADLTAAFEALNYSTRKEHARTVSEAKAEATRERRITKIIQSL
ncbi:MAG: hypothetical protein JWL79_2113 [Frankiales bacterium]|nr:hypothetical protein [Frankiales bacterium]